MRITVRVLDLEASVRFFTEICGLSVIRDRRREQGGVVWLGPDSATHAFPKFVIMLIKSDVPAPCDRYRLDCDSHAKIAAIARRAKARGILIEGPIDYEDGAGRLVAVREPTGHIVECASVNATP